MSDKQQAFLVTILVVVLFLVGFFSARWGFFIGAESVYTGQTVCEKALNVWVCETSKEIK